MLSQKQLEDICLLLIGDHRQCRYAQEDPTNWQWYCMKHKKSTKDRIDESVDVFLNHCKLNKVDPKSQGVALGDNCKGYPVMKTLLQGYDCP